MKSDQILFDTDDIQVRYVAHTDTLHPDVCFVTFSPRQAAGISTGFGEGLFTARRINAFHFISKWNHWWQTDDFATAAAVVDAFLKDGDCKRLVAYGSSMGGTGALLASQHLPVTETLVFCPQYSMDPAIVPDEVRWKALVPLITFGPDMMPSIRPSVRQARPMSCRTRFSRRTRSMCTEPARADRSTSSPWPSQITMCQRSSNSTACCNGRFSVFLRHRSIRLR